MPMPLDQWQERLEGHFAALKKDREQSDHPIFALEHDLNEEELKEIGGHLQDRLKAGARLSPYWLVWVVYATEQGYDYDGDEFWQSYARNTPNWTFSHRNLLKPWFRKFQSEYNGVEPSGPWAGQFRIIAWPITHAILPLYLQREFAKALYDLRWSLASIPNLSAGNIGRLLATRADASTRFDEFLQQEELTGRIVLAVLGKSDEDDDRGIYGPTLKRIVSDLEKASSSRRHLRDAKCALNDRIKGVGRFGPVAPRTWTPEVGDAGSPRNPNIQPRMMLHHIGANKWSVVMEIPDLRSMAVNSEILAFLRTTRSSVNGEGGKKAAGWLLAPNRRAVLRTWPDATKPLITFEKANQLVNSMLETDCRLSAGPLWLFRLGSDGIAREIITRLIRPGRDYLVVAKGELPPGPMAVNACAFECAGVNLFRFHASSKMSADEIAWFQKIGMQVARTIRVWPAGFPGRAWDGEGHGEWLTTEVPCFGIVHDFPVAAYKLSLNGGPESAIVAGKVGFPSFIRLPHLAPGLHQLKVKVQHDGSMATVPAASASEGRILLKVREPAPWTPGKLAHHGLIVSLDPPDIDLDAVCDNELQVSVLGPSSYRVTCTLTLFDGANNVVFSNQVSEPLELPITPDVWRRKFGDFLKNSAAVDKCLEARSGSLSFAADELGEHLARFERDVMPVRWIFRTQQEKIVGRLIDDSGHTENQEASRFYSMASPTVAKTIEPSSVLSEFDVADSGGLFVAKRGEHKDAVVVAARRKATQLNDLATVPTFPELNDGSLSPAEACQVLELWSTARLTGFMPKIRREKITDSLAEAIFEHMCGSDWVRAERRFRDNPANMELLEALTPKVIRNNGFAASLKINHDKQNYDHMGGITRWFASQADLYGVCKDQRQCEFALRLASEPSKLPSIYGADLASLLDAVRANAPVVKGARLLASMRVAKEGAGKLLPRWSW